MNEICEICRVRQKIVNFNNCFACLNIPLQHPLMHLGLAPIPFLSPIPKLFGNSTKKVECTLSSDLGGMLTNMTFSDVTIVVSGKEFSAHKNILSGMKLLRIG